MKCKPRKLCGKINCTCFHRSFASHAKSIYWSKSNIIGPNKVLKSSHTKYWFTCHICNHDFNVEIRKIILHNRWCPYCGHQKLCPNKDCILCFKNSFASQEKAKYWYHEQNNLTPRQVFKSSGNKYWFQCKNNHIFQKALNSLQRGSWCPKCCIGQNFSKKQIAWLEYEMKKDNLYIQHALNDGEFSFKKFRADGFCKETNTWYIFQGDFWHCNPELFSPSYIHPLTKKRAIDIWIFDLNRINELNKKFNIKIIWENEWDQIVSSMY